MDSKQGVVNGHSRNDPRDELRNARALIAETVRYHTLWEEAQRRGNPISPFNRSLIPITALPLPLHGPSSGAILQNEPLVQPPKSPMPLPKMPFKDVYKAHMAAQRELLAQQTAQKRAAPQNQNQSHGDGSRRRKRKSEPLRDGRCKSAFTRVKPRKAKTENEQRVVIYPPPRFGAAPIEGQLQMNPIQSTSVVTASPHLPQGQSLPGSQGLWKAGIPMQTASIGCSVEEVQAQFDSQPSFPSLSQDQLIQMQHGMLQSLLSPVPAAAAAALPDEAVTSSTEVNPRAIEDLQVLPASDPPYTPLNSLAIQRLNTDEREAVFDRDGSSFFPVRQSPSDAASLVAQEALRKEKEVERQLAEQKQKFVDKERELSQAREKITDTEQEARKEKEKVTGEMADLKKELDSKGQKILDAHEKIKSLDLENAQKKLDAEREKAALEEMLRSKEGELVNAHARILSLEQEKAQKKVEAESERAALEEMLNSKEHDLIEARRRIEELKQEARDRETRETLNEMDESEREHQDVAEDKKEMDDSLEGAPSDAASSSKVSDRLMVETRQERMALYKEVDAVFDKFPKLEQNTTIMLADFAADVGKTLEVIIEENDNLWDSLSKIRPFITPDDANACEQWMTVGGEDDVDVRSLLHLVAYLNQSKKGSSLNRLDRLYTKHDASTPDDLVDLLAQKSKTNFPLVVNSGHRFHLYLCSRAIPVDGGLRLAMLSFVAATHLFDAQFDGSVGDVARFFWIGAGMGLPRVPVAVKNAHDICKGAIRP